MTHWQTTNAQGVQFFLDPRPARPATMGGKGWCVLARCPHQYGGNYWAAVGWADKVETGFIAFRLKRDAQLAIDEAKRLGIVRNTLPE